MKQKKARLISFYLPQFHPIPENDLWWGRGFTEWTNVGKAKPLFPGHYQPHVPADLGYYDLRVPETRTAQAEMAKEYGIEAFCYYHYWFAGKRLLERPFEDVLRTKEPDFPFCLCWANETWTGIWHGTPQRILIEQTYPGYADHKAHFDMLLRAFADPRYVTVGGKPLFFIYRPWEIPSVHDVLYFWRELALKSGLKGLYIVGILTNEEVAMPKGSFDAFVVNRIRPQVSKVPQIRKTVWKLFHLFQYGKRGFPRVCLYEDLLHLGAKQDLPPRGDYHPQVVPNWDNTPRSGSLGLILHRSTPNLFRMLIRKALKSVENRDDDHRIIMIKSWNEWAEGNHLEPDLRFGRSYLEVIRNEVYRSTESNDRDDPMTDRRGNERSIHKGPGPDLKSPHRRLW